MRAPVGMCACMGIGEEGAMPRRFVVVCDRGCPGRHELLQMRFHEEHALASVREVGVIRFQPHLRRQRRWAIRIARMRDAPVECAPRVHGTASMAMLRAWWPLTEPIRSKCASSG